MANLIVMACMVVPGTLVGYENRPAFEKLQAGGSVPCGKRSNGTNGGALKTCFDCYGYFLPLSPAKSPFCSFAAFTLCHSCKLWYAMG